MKRIYLDTNVLISFLRSEIGKGFRLLHQEAEDFFKCAPTKCILVLSDFLFKEVKEKIPVAPEDIVNTLLELGLKIDVLESVEDDLRFAASLAVPPLHIEDAFHVAIAIRAGCDAIVTFNKKDFLPVGKRLAVFEPSEAVQILSP